MSGAIWRRGPEGRRRATFRAAAARVPRRAPRRGAIMIEALVVISFFVLCFLGVGYFRQLYVQKLHVQRLARASALAHAMSACASDPQGPIARDTGARRFASDTAPGLPFDALPDVPAVPGSEKGAAGLQAIRDKHGDTGLDEVTEVTLAGDARMTSRPAPDGPELGFRGVVSSTSHVVCADPVHEDRYEGMAQRIADLF